ncbi:sugar transferase [Anaerocolumna aminovalerica]|uniref:sugar transferase n=1 Tax=Anaerocolumna aminovalerica TaxID=1527 RepID=UPI003AB97647
MDFVLSLITIIIFSPVLLIVAILVRINLGINVIFNQKRPGLNKRYKYGKKG